MEASHPRGLEVRQNVCPRGVDSGSSACRGVSGHREGRAQLSREAGWGASGGHHSQLATGGSIRRDSGEQLAVAGGVMQEEPRGVSIWGAVWPAVTNGESGMRIMTALLRGNSGESVTGSNESKPPAHAWQVVSDQ